MKSSDGSLEITVILNYYHKSLILSETRVVLSQIKAAGGGAVPVPARVPLLGMILWHFLLFQKELPLNNYLLSINSVLISVWLCFIGCLLISLCFSTQKFW